MTSSSYTCASPIASATVPATVRPPRCSIGRRDRGGARERQPERLGDDGHRRGSAHGHARAGGTCDTCLHIVPLSLSDVAGFLLGPVFPDVGARAENLAAKVAAHHRPR